MTRILILTYFYKPANFVACERIHSWAKYFKENDLYPIIITRHWNEGQTDIVDQINAKKLKIVKYDNYEVHYLPYKNSLRDKLANSKKFVSIRKLLSFITILTETLFFNFSRNKVFYNYSSDYLDANLDVRIVIASGRPFYLFKIASLLSKKNKIKWIADYRDEWTTIQPKPKLSFMNKFLFFIHKRNERKWINSSSFFSTTSENIKNRISEVYNKKGVVIYNGYDGEILLQDFNNKYSNTINIVYAGTLYSYQNTELLIDSVKKFNRSNSSLTLKVTYVGVEAVPSELKKLKIKISNHPEFKILPKMNYKDLMEFYKKMDILYLTSYEQNKGWLPVKLFDYYKIGKPILLFPSDNDIMSDFIKRSNSGVSCSNSKEFESFIFRLKNGNLNFKRNKEVGSFFSRKYQAQIFCDEIKNII